MLLLPDGPETVESQWFAKSDVKKVVVSSSVMTIESGAFSGCR